MDVAMTRVSVLMLVRMLIPLSMILATQRSWGPSGSRSLASRRKRGPVAFRLWLSLGLPLSVMTEFYVGQGTMRQLRHIHTIT
jgi:hypothetical protein